MSDDVLSAWRAHLAPRPVTLSNGLQVMIRQAPLEALLIRGLIPLTLFETAQEATQERKRAGKKGIDDNFLKIVPQIHAVIMAAAVAPQIAEVQNLDEGVVSIHDISLDDQLLLFNEANRAATALRPFPGRPAAGGDIAPDGDDVPPAAE